MHDLSRTRVNDVTFFWHQLQKMYVLHGKIVDFIFDVIDAQFFLELFPVVVLRGLLEW